MQLRRTLIICIVTALLGGCASTSTDIEPVPASMAPYANLSCDALRRHGHQTSVQIEAIRETIADTSVSDRLAMGIGLVFWPALFMIDGNGDKQDKLAILKGQQISIEDTLFELNCTGRQPKLRADRIATQTTVNSLFNQERRQTLTTR